MLSNSIEIILVGILVCACCALPGTFLVLRGMSMITDAISHTVLLGIVIGFFISNNLNSPLIIFFSVVVGLFTVWFTELLHNTNLLNKDSAIGVVFPILFSIAVLLITKFAKNTHLDVEHVVFGEIAFTPFDRIETLNYDFGPRAIIVLLVIFIVNLIVILLFYKEFIVSTFNPEYAKIIGFSPIFMHYLLMSLVSLTSVGAFKSVGVVLVIAFMVGPTLTARLITNKLSLLIVFSIIIGTISSIIGYFLAIYFDVSISGMQATVVGIIFLIVFVFSNKIRI